MSIIRDRHPGFFPAVSLLLAAIVYYGFAPTYYHRPADAAPIPLYLHVHGAAMTGWFLLLIVQTALIARRQRSLHRQLGFVASALGIAIVLLTPVVVVRFVPTLVANGTAPATVALIVLGDLNALIVFGVLLVSAVRTRRRPDSHARLLLAASMLIVAPALGRVSMTASGTPIPGLVVHMSLPLLLVLHDVLMMRRVHRATVWGTAAVVGTMLASIAVANTPIGPAFIRLLNG